MTKVILISQFPLPYNKIGSWTTLYQNYLLQDSQIDVVVCPKPHYLFHKVIYSYVSQTLLAKYKNKLLRNNHQNFINALSKKLNENDKYIIQVVDNYGLINALNSFLIKKNIRKNCYIQYFYHGFSPIIKNPKEKTFFSKFDEMVFLTALAKENFFRYYENFEVKTAVLNNGIDSNNFKKLDTNSRLEQRKKINISDKIIFTWCSRDTPQKGLSLLLKAWQELIKKYSNIELWIIGSEEKYTHKGVVNIGKVQNDKLPYYFQLSNCYIFPTQCEEGFGMSLIEALHCGNYCIASSVGGVPEVLQKGKFGKLIENFSDSESWRIEMEKFIKNQSYKTNFSFDLYTSTEWNKQMNTIIYNAKNKFNE